jgi:hypothetical protein
MPALVRVSGPNDIYIGFKSANGSLVTYSYFGTCEMVPNYEERKNFGSVMNALSGSILPFDELYQGSDWVVTMQLTRYDELVAQALKTAPFPLVTATPGGDSRLSRGSLMYNRFAVEVVVVNTFFGTANGLPDDLPGYRFYIGLYMGSNPSPGGTLANNLGVSFLCRNLFDPLTRGFAVYTNILPPLPTPN